MRAWVLSVLVVGALVAACGQSEDGGDEEVLVSAASSLTSAFTEMEAAFEASHPGLDVVLNFGSSSLLREQILGGAPVDVFASASTEIMGEVAAAGRLAGDIEVFALNRVQIAVPAGNPGEVIGLASFAERDLLIGLCAEGVPCGDLGRSALEMADVKPRIDTEEPNARSLLVKLEAGELDAGITYETDVISSESVEGLEMPEDVDVVAEYSIAALGNGSQTVGAAELVSYVLSAEGRAILVDHGFVVP